MILFSKLKHPVKKTSLKYMQLLCENWTRQRLTENPADVLSAELFPNNHRCADTWLFSRTLDLQVPLLGKGYPPAAALSKYIFFVGKNSVCLEDKLTFVSCPL